MGLLERIIEARSYAAAKVMYDVADTRASREALPKTELMGLVKIITFGLASGKRPRKPRRRKGR